MRHATATETRRPTGRLVLPTLLIAALSLGAGNADAALAVSRWVVAGGGAGPSVGGVYSLTGTTGQIAAGSLSVSLYDLMSGFWGKPGGGSVSVGDPEIELGAPSYQLGIFPTSPNPARSQARIQFELPDARRVAVQVFDVNGRVVQDVASGRLGPGRHQFTWNMRTPSGQAVGAGIYFVRIDLGDLVRTQRLAVIR